jgi:hypothetical protein
MQDFEKLGLFYLGRGYDPKTSRAQDDLVLYKSKDLTTHAVCVGMTGSGKTGLCLTLLEEAAIDGIPAIAIDPKGDLGNLLLTFPDLKPDDFRPWVDPSEAARQGITPEQLADKTAKTWQEGLAQWGEDGARIARLRSAVDMNIYTPASSAGIPLTVLRSFTAPPQALLDDADALRERITAAASGLLALLGVSADSLRSQEHILLSTILDRAWRAGRDLDMAALIREIQTPSFDKVGVIDLETFYPAKQRFELAMQLNNLMASPGFSAWMEGESLDINKLLYTSAGRPRLSVISIAHLSDSERMFFVTILLNEMIAWMRSQTGTSSLRAILYMDEVFGFFPPTANPPSKTPMLTLLKQARAFGLGVVLASQNPVDLDYKGLANAGTWFLGRLQTERDKARVLDGLEGASAEAGAKFDRKLMGETLSRLSNRVFLMNNVHDDQPVVFQTRWTLSYLSGPLTRDQIRSLMAPKKAALAPPAAVPSSTAAPNSAGPAAATTPAPAASAPINTFVGADQRPVVPPGIPEFFVPLRSKVAPGQKLRYLPSLLATGRVHFTDAKSSLDHWDQVALLSPVGEAVPDDVWESAKPWEGDAPELEKQPENAAGFASLPGQLTKPKSYTSWTTALKSHLYRSELLTLWKCGTLSAASKPNESEAEFRLRLSQAAREDRDSQVEKLHDRYGPKMNTLKEQIRKAEQRVEKEKTQATQQTVQAGISVVTSVLGAFFSKKMTSTTNIGRAATAMRAAGKATLQHGGVNHAEETVEALTQRLADLETEMKQEVDAIQERLQPDKLQLDQLQLKPKKSDISIDKVVLAWLPYKVAPDGSTEPAY